MTKKENKYTLSCLSCSSCVNSAAPGAVSATPLSMWDSPGKVLEGLHALLRGSFYWIKPRDPIAVTFLPSELQGSFTFLLNTRKCYNEDELGRCIKLYLKSQYIWKGANQRPCAKLESRKTLPLFSLELFFLIHELLLSIVQCIF